MIGTPFIPSGLMRFAIMERFLPKAKRCPHTGCLIWTAATSTGGQRNHSGPYGSFWIKGHNSVRAHVVAAWLAGIVGELRVPPGMNLDHTCENTLCVDPLHLELVTDTVNRERYHNGRTSGPPPAEDWCPF